MCPGSNSDSDRAFDGDPKGGSPFFHSTPRGLGAGPTAAEGDAGANRARAASLAQLSVPTGGAGAGAGGVVASSPTPGAESSAEEVWAWLRDVRKLPSALLDEFEGVDGVSRA